MLHFFLPDDCKGADIHNPNFLETVLLVDSIVPDPGFDPLSFGSIQISEVPN